MTEFNFPRTDVAAAELFSAWHAYLFRLSGYFHNNPLKNERTFHSWFIIQNFSKSGIRRFRIKRPNTEDAKAIYSTTEQIFSLASPYRTDPR